VRPDPLFIGCIAICGCAAFDVEPPPARPRGEVQVEPLGDLGAAPSVLRLRVKGAGGSSALGDFRLFSGHLTSYYLGRLKAREVPVTLEERAIGVAAWAEGADVVVAPTQALPAGVVSLATPELGLVAEVTVRAELVPWLARRWPPPGAVEGSGLAIFCGADVAAASPGDVTLAPSGLRAEVRRGVDAEGSFGETCLAVVPREAGTNGALSLPPVLVGDVGLEPLPLVTATPAATTAECPDGELALGPACATVDDDRLTLRAYGAPSLWAFGAPVRALALVEPGTSYVVKGLEPASRVALQATALDAAGLAYAIHTDVTTRERRDHVVINEVLSNPSGREPSSEWLELENDGAEAVDLAGFVLKDAGGAVTLPAARIEPGEFVLLVAQAFDPDGALDVLPRSGTRLVRLPMLGTDGLSNSGEPLRLSDASGHLLSFFPSLPAHTAGVSIARRAPEALDDESGAFGVHAAPGASPGAANVLAPP